MIQRLFLNDKFILNLIVASCILIFASGLELDNDTLYWFEILDAFIVVLFIIEAIIKIKYHGWTKYINDRWNRFDFFIVVISIPSLIVLLFEFDLTGLGILPMFRAIRIFRSFRLFRFIKGVDMLLLGIVRALKTSVIIFIGFIIYIFIVAVMSYNFFHEVSPEHFGNTGISLYSTFKTFSIEGWFEIPEEIVLGQSSLFKVMTYFYFVFVVVTGGMFGLSLVNSIFVDAMVADNNDELIAKIENLENKINQLLELKNKQD